jgi:hypothetical protein
MKIRIKGFLLAVVSACLINATGAMAATEDQKQQAIQDGLANLYDNQQPGGYWSYGGYEPAATGAAVLAFVSQTGLWGDHETEYQAAVDAAVSYLLQAATKITVSTRNDGVNICPGGSAECPAVFWNAANNEDSYTTGLIMPGLMVYAAGKADEAATESGPLAGMTWGEIAQANINLWAASQSTANQGNRQGGWRYILGAGGYDSDMSTTQWGIISLIYAEALGATTPPIVRTDLEEWLAVAQDPISGAGCYQPGVAPCNHSDTGGLLLGLKFIGKDSDDSAVEAALEFLNGNWIELANNRWYGNFGHPYAMWSVYKGLEVNIGLDDTTSITNLLSTCGAPGDLPGDPPGSKPCNWWEDYNESLVDAQNADGGWSGYQDWYGPLATAFNVNILGATSVPVEDTNPPVCESHVRAGPPPYLEATCTETAPNDTGIFFVQLDEGASNLTLTVDPFEQGDPEVDFVADLIDTCAVGMGTVTVTDGAGNSTAVIVDLEPQDSDGDGIPDDCDICVASDLRDTVNIGICNSQVGNTLLPSGCTIADLVRPVAENDDTNLNRTLSEVQDLSFELKEDGYLRLLGVRALVSATLGNAWGRCWAYAD